MPLSFDSNTLTASHPSRPLPWLPWIASALFVVGIIAALGTVIAVIAGGEDDEFRVSVVDSESNGALANAMVTINGTEYVTGEDGVLVLPAPQGRTTISIERDGYLAKNGEVDLQGDSLNWVVPLRTQKTSQLAQTTNEPDEPDGEGAAVAAATEAPPTIAEAVSTQQATEVVAVSVQGTPDVVQADATPGTPPATTDGELAGTIVNAEGEPVQGALLTDGSTTEITGADGLFSVQGSDFNSDTLRVSASGYADSTISLGQGGDSVTVQLELQPVKAIYYNPNISNTQEDVDRLINLINITEVNAIVIDVKEEIIFYDTQVEFFREADTVRPILDIPAVLQQFQEHDIYTIARHVVFKDGLVAEHRPDLAVTSNVTGEVWRDMNGVAWVNPMMHALWEPNIALSVELAELGFDEIQYDYVRFPTDGDLSTMEFGLEYNEENRVNAIRKFLQQTQAALLPTGAKLSADVFGFTVLVPDDLGIGQDLTELAPYVDYLSPMVYPSHFPNGSMALDGHPNDFPYETIEISMSAGKEQLGSALQLRPWLQDFDYWEMIPYGVEEVRAQIDAAEDVGTSGWMLWDPNNVYTDGALGPDDGNMSRFELPQAVLPGSGASRTLGRFASA